MSQHEKVVPEAAPPVLPPTLRLRAAHLTVTDLDRSVAFYEEAAGLQLHRREYSVAAMGVGEVHLRKILPKIAKKP